MGIRCFHSSFWLPLTLCPLLSTCSAGPFKVMQSAYCVIPPTLLLIKWLSYYFKPTTIHLPSGASYSLATKLIEIFANFPFFQVYADLQNIWATEAPQAKIPSCEVTTGNGSPFTSLSLMYNHNHM